MATKLTRVFMKLFGSTGDVSYFGQFGSNAGGGGTKTKDISSIQGGSAYDTGWQDAVNPTNKAPFLEDMNSLFYLNSYQFTYLLQEGIPEYDGNSFYFIGGIVKKTGTSELYVSLQDDQQGNALPTQTDSAYWKFLGDLRRLETSNVMCCMGLANAYPVNATQKVSNNSNSYVALELQMVNLGNIYATNHFVAPVAGYYQVNANVGYIAGVAGKRYMALVWDVTNGVSIATGISQASGTGNISANVSKLIYLNAGQVIDLYTYQDSGADAYLAYDAAYSPLTYMSVQLVRQEF